MGNCNLFTTNTTFGGLTTQKKLIDFEKPRKYVEQTPSGCDTSMTTFLSFGTRANATVQKYKPPVSTQKSGSFTDVGESRYKYDKRSTASSNELEATPHRTPQSRSKSIAR